VVAEASARCSGCGGVGVAVSLAVPGARPRRDPWTASLHDAAEGSGVLGTGVVIDESRILTCAHVVVQSGVTLWVGFPKAAGASSVRRRVAEVRAAPGADVAVVELAEPVPVGVVAARLRCPEPSDLVDERWWAFGFPADAPFGADAFGSVGAALGYGWVRLDTESRYVVKPGFSGAGLWSPRFDAVVGLVGQTQQGGDRAGDGLAMSLFQADQELPDEKLLRLAGWSVSAAGEQALAAWGWSLTGDPEAGQHWRPRARGVAADAEGGFRFRGRRAALETVVGFLNRPAADGRVLVVTGSPGVGKSAVLGRVVTTADAEIRATLPATDDAVCAAVGSVACAVHAKSKTALDVATEIARAASVRLPEDVAELTTSLLARLASSPGRRFNVVIDALDEVTSPKQARMIVEKIVLPMATRCAEFGARVVVGSRRRDDGGDLMRALGSEVELIDLDDQRFFAEQDLIDYALASLQLLGAERPDNPYAVDGIAQPVARRIAILAQGNFLIAGLVARTHGLHDIRPIDASQLVFPPDVVGALGDYLRRLPPVGHGSAAQALVPLAYAQAPGLTLGAWHALLGAFGGRASLKQLTAFTGSAAANFLLESGSDGTHPTYRLFHQALNDALIFGRGNQQSDQYIMAQTLLQRGRTQGWAEADRYLLRSLPDHAYRAGLLDELLIDNEYLLYADLLRMLALANAARSVRAQARARLIRLTPAALYASPAERSALFSVATTLEDGSDATFPAQPEAQYRGRWATGAQRAHEWIVLEGHATPPTVVCAMHTSRNDFLASASDQDSVIIIWNPTNGAEHCRLHGHHQLPGRHGGIIALCTLLMDDRVMLVSAAADRTVRIWDIRDACCVQTLDLPNAAAVLCPVELDGHHLLAVASGPDLTSGTITIWDPVSGKVLRVLRGHKRNITALCTFVFADKTVLASASSDQTVRLWDLKTGEQLGLLDHVGLLSSEEMPGQPLPSGLGRHAHIEVSAVRAARVDGRDVLFTATSNGAVREWDDWRVSETAPDSGFSFNAGKIALAFAEAGHHSFLAATTVDGDIRVWKPAHRISWNERSLGLSIRANSLCALTIDDNPLLAGTAVDDNMVYIWDFRDWRGSSGTSRWEDMDDEPGTPGAASIAIDALTFNGQPVIAAARGNRVELRHIHDGRQMARHTMPNVSGLSRVNVDGRWQIAGLTRGDDSYAVVVWDPDSNRSTISVRRGHGLKSWGVEAFKVIQIADRDMAVLHDNKGRLRLWEVGSGRAARRGITKFPALRYEPEKIGSKRSSWRWVEQLCLLGMDDVSLLAGAGGSRIFIWDLNNYRQIQLLDAEAGSVFALCAVTLGGRLGLASGDVDGVVRIWDPISGGQIHAFKGHLASVKALCAVRLSGHEILVSGSHDRTIRLWDPESGSHLLTIDIGRQVLSCIAVGETLAVGLDRGLLAIELAEDLVRSG
jgi:WD40 repeat protein